MADYIWARDGVILGATRTAGTDADEVEALPSREIQRLLDRGYISLKPDVPEVDLSSKQDASTAATDAELATGLSSKQDAATAATDAELTSGLAAKQDAATAATDAELAAAIAGVAGLTYEGPWISTLTYAKGSVVTRAGGLYLAKDAVAAANDPAAPPSNGTVLASTTTVAAKSKLSDFGLNGLRVAQVFTLTSAQVVRSVGLDVSAATVTGSSYVALVEGSVSGVGSYTPLTVGKVADSPTTGMVAAVFDSDVQLKAGTIYSLVLEGTATGSILASAQMAANADATLSGITHPGASYIWYGDTFGTALTTHKLLFQLRAPAATALWETLTPAQWKRGVHGVLMPVDYRDSWVVGSDRMDRDPADATKNFRMFFNKPKRAFRSGNASADQWNDVNVGDGSSGFGSSTIASGQNSFAEGGNTTASGNNSHAEGTSTVSSATSSHAEGQSTAASGSAAHAEGNATTASGTNSHAEGSNTTASGASSHAEGQYTTASGQNAHAEGDNSVASGNQSRATGRYATATRKTQQSHAATRFATNGDAQSCSMGLMHSTADATPLLLTATMGTATLTGADTNVLTLTASRAYQLKISAVARRTDTQGEMAGFTWEGLVGRDSTGSARIIGTPIEAAWGDTPATNAWTVAVSIDTTDATNNYVKVTATGEAGKTIRWVAKMEWVEVAG